MLKSLFDYVRFRFVHFNKFIRGFENRIQTLLVMHCPLNANLICKQMLVEMKKKCKFDLFVVFHSFLYVASWLWRLGVSLQTLESGFESRRRKVLYERLNFELEFFFKFGQNYLIILAYNCVLEYMQV